MLLVTLLAPQRKEGYLCSAVCVLTPQQNISVRFWGGHRLAFGDELFPVEKIIPYTCLLLDSPMLSFRVRSCSLLEPEHSRLTPYIPFALLGIVYCHELPGFRCPLQPVRLPASQHTIQRRCVSQHTKSAVQRFVLLMKAHLIHGVQFLGTTYFTFFGDIGVNTSKRVQLSVYRYVLLLLFRFFSNTTVVCVIVWYFLPLITPVLFSWYDSRVWFILFRIG